MALKVGELYASFGIDSSGIDGAISGIEKKCAGIASTLAKVGTGLSLALTTPIVAFGKDVFNVGTEFEAQMSRVQGISEATGAELELLTQTAKDLGASSVYSASEAAQGMEYLASAGFDVNEIVAAMPGMLNLAASSGEDLATSAEIAASMLNGFGLEADQASHVADVLAKTAARTNASVYDTGEAMKYVAPLANTMGISMEETAAAIGIMSDAGIKGSQAGTSLRSAFSRMAKPTDVMTDKMDELGISFYDNNGKMKSITETVGMLQNSFVGLTDEQKQNALVTLFGQESLSGWMVLLEAGPEELAAMTSALENCDGAAQDMATTMLDNLKGAMEEFNGSLETLKLNIYDSFEPAMKTAVQKATEIANSFNLMDESTKMGIYKFVGLAAAAGPVIAALGGVVAIAGKLIPILSALVSPVGIVAGGLALFAAAAIDANNDIGKALTMLSKKGKQKLGDFNKTITTTMKTISKRMPALMDSIKTGINDVLPGLMDAASNIITGLMDAITDNASDILEIGQTIVTNVVGGISRNLPKLVPAAANMITSIATAIIGNIPELVSMAGTLVASVWDSIKNVDWAQLGKDLITAIFDAGKELGKIFEGWFDDLKNIDLGAVWEKIKTGFNQVGEHIKSLVMGDSYVPDKTSWSDVGEKIWTSIKSGIKATGDWIKKLVLGDNYEPDASWGSVGTKILEKIAVTEEKLKAKAVEILQSLIGKLGDPSIGTTIEDASGVIGTIASKIVSKASDWITTATTLLSDLISALADSGVLAAVISGAGTVFSDIVNSLSKAISDNAGEIIDCASDLVEQVVLGLKLFFEEVDWAGLGNTIKTLFAKIPWDEVAFNACGLFGAAFRAALEVAFGEDTAEILMPQATVDWYFDQAKMRSDMDDAFDEWFDNYVPPTVEVDAGESVTVMTMSAEESIGMMFDTIDRCIEAGSMSSRDEMALAVSSMAQGYWDEVQATNPEIYNAASSIFQQIKYAQDESDILNAFSKMGYTITNDLATSILSGQVKIENAVLGIMSGLDSSLIEGTSSSEIKEFLLQYFTDASTQVSSLLEDSATDWGKIFGQAIPDGATVGLEAGMYVLRSKTGDVIKLVSAVDAESTVKAGNEATAQAGVDAMADTTEAGTEDVGASAQTLLEAIETPFDTLPEDQKAQAAAMLEAVNLAITSGTPAATATMKIAADAIVKIAAQIMSTGKGASIATDFLNGVKSAINSMRGSVASASSATANSAKQAASSVLSYSAGSSIGVQFSNGIAAGIKAGSSAIAAAARAAAQAALNAAKNTLGIHSPSTVAEREIGYMYDEGVANGLLKRMGIIADASRQVSSELHDSFYVGDPSRGTVYTSGDAIQQTARQTAQASADEQSAAERAKAIGTAMADRLIESGALAGDVIMDKEKVGEKVSAPVSKAIRRKTNTTVAGRSAQGVLA